MLFLSQKNPEKSLKQYGRYIAGKRFLPMYNEIKNNTWLLINFGHGMHLIKFVITFEVKTSLSVGFDRHLGCGLRVRSKLIVVLDIVEGVKPIELASIIVTFQPSAAILVSETEPVHWFTLSQTEINFNLEVEI